MFFALGILVFILLVILILGVYVKKPKYGVELAVLAVVLYAGFTVWSLFDESLTEKRQHRIDKTYLELTNEQLSVAYGSFVSYQATLHNNSPEYRVVAIELELHINCDEKDVCPIEPSRVLVDTWIDASQQKQIKTFFRLDKLSKNIPLSDWTVKVLSSRAD